MTYDPQNGMAGGAAYGGAPAGADATGLRSGQYGGAGGRAKGASGSTSGYAGQIGGKFSGAKDQLVSGFGRLVDSAESQIHRAPSDLQPGLRGAAKIARDRPIATMIGLAGVALLLARGQRNRY